MKKRFVSLLLVVCMIMTLFPAAVFGDTSAQSSSAATNPFTDVKASDWYFDAVQYARANGFFNGTSADTFDPNGTMTRGMFVTVLGRMAGVDADDYKGESIFSDVPADAYYAPYVAWASEYGITSGTSETTFSPNALITREQMAVFFVRYFEAFDVDYETGANITTTPADLDSVASYAQDAVLKLWKQGLLNGNGKTFDAKSNASRAQTATLCMRADEAVDTWYSEPGVASERVSVDPVTGEPVKPGKEENKPSTEPSYDWSSGSDSGSTTRYYEVKFAMGSDQSVAITLPETGTYAADTLISNLPTPGKAGAIFLGWYYDAAMTDSVETGDVVDRNMTLYAKVAAGEEVTSFETPNYVTRTEVAAGTYSFDVIGADDLDSAFKFIHITGGNMDVEYSVQGTTVSATLEAGQTYQVELTDDAAQFLLNGESEAQPESIRYLNILTAKEQVTNAELNGDVKRIPVSDTSGLSSDVFDGLYQIDESGAAAQNESKGTFTYTGNQDLQVGDTVAITSGDVDLDDVTSTEGDVAYVKITEKNGNTYSYEMAEVEDVLSLPDVLPIESDWDIDSTDNQITISAGNLAAAMDNVDADSLDAGDFLGFLGENTSYSDDAEAVSYGKIIGYAIDANENYIITYTSATEEEIAGSLDVYYTKEHEIELTEEEKEQIENEIKNDVQSSGYVEEAALYLASVMLESDNLQEIPDMEQVVSGMRTMQGSVTRYNSGSVTRAGGGNTVTVSFDKANMAVGISANSQLEHLKGKGFDVLVRVPFVVTIAGSGDNKVKIRVTAEFEEEVILKQNISTKRHKMGFLKYDYSLNASFEVGNYTGIDFTADIYTADGSDEALTKKLEAIMDRMEDYQNGGTDLNDGTMDSLSEIYQDVMDRANDTWIDILNVSLFETNGNAFLHLFCWQVKGSFVVSANLNVSMGMNFDYTMQKQYNFSVRVKAKTATNEVIDIIEPHYNFNFYVVGTIGIRAGLRLEMYVGLISLKLDKVGITAEVGAYTRLWGYFFYHLEWSQSGGKKSNSAGAMLVEIGIYLEIKFVAQLFDSNKLTWDPTLYAHEWPLWSAGEQKNVYAFARTNDTDYTLVSTKTLALPGSTYAMQYMNLKDGKTGIVSKDDAEESSFLISFSNPAFTYVPATNTVVITPAKGSLAEEADMIITWKRAALSFTSTPIQKIIHLSWSDPESMRYISFDSMGGSAVAQLVGGSGAPITWPADPTKQGYDFAGWYTDSACTAAYTGSTSEMPAFSEDSKGMTLYAKWTPAITNYTVEHYLKELNGTYSLKDTEQKTGTTGTTTNAVAYSIYTGFYGRSIEQQTIAADGSTVVKVYYDRELYAVKFAMNDGSSESISKVYRYGEMVAAPVLARDGYVFAGWSPAVPEAAVETATYTAIWAPAADTPYLVKHYQEQLDGTYVLIPEDTTSMTGTTDAIAEVEIKNYTGFAEPAIPEVTISADGSTVVELYYDREHYTVTYDSKGGSAVAAQSGIPYGGTTTAPAAPTLDGYGFGGWFADADCRTPWDFETNTVNGPTTLYAKWNISQYTITFDTDGGSAVAPITQDYNTAVTAPAAPTKTGYTFAGWDKEIPATMPAEDLTIQAKWTVNQYTITFDSNGGSAVAPITQDYNTAVKAPMVPSKTGYTFAGWTPALPATMPAENVTVKAQWTANDGIAYEVWYCYMDVDGTYPENLQGYWAKEGVAGETVDLTKDPSYEVNGYTIDQERSTLTGTIAGDGTLNLCVYYARNKYNLTFDANGGEGGTSQSVYYGAAIVAPAVTKEGCTFAGWTPNLLYAMPAGDLTYTAVWEGNTEYTISYYEMNVNGGYDLVKTETPKGMPGDAVSANITAPAGFTYNAEKSNAEGTIAADGSTVLAVYFDRNQYTLTFEANGGTWGDGSTAAKTLTGYYGADFTAPVPTKAGSAYTWSPALPETIPLDGGSYTAQWDLTKHTVYWMNGNMQMEKDVDVAYGTTPEYNGETPTKAADAQYTYTFSGWAPAISEVTGDVTYQAQFSKTVNEYTIIFANSDGEVLQSGKAAYGETPEYTGETPTKEADAQYTYTFRGWDPAIGAVTGEATYTAQYSATVNEYTITFVNTDGEVLQSGKLAYGELPEYTGETPLRPEDPNLYAFDGWTPAITTVTGEATYTATYAEAVNTVTWTVDGVIVETDEDVPYGAKPEYNGEEPSKTDYVFFGWQDRNGNLLTEETIVTGNVTFEAMLVDKNTTYGLRVRNQDVTAGRLTIPAAVTGTATFDPLTNTLTLSDYRAEAERFGEPLINYTGTKPLNIVLEHESILSTDDEYPALYSETADMIISYGRGSGKLTAQNSCKDYYINRAIECFGNLIINEGVTVTAIGYGGTETTCGIAVNKDLIVNGGSLTVQVKYTNGAEYICGLLANLVVNGGTVVVDCSRVADSYGTFYNVTINGGSVTIIGKKQACKFNPVVAETVSATVSPYENGNGAVEYTGNEESTSYLWFHTLAQ